MNVARETGSEARDLTTGRAPFIEEARDRGDLFIDQPYESYSTENQSTWRRLYEGMLPKWKRFAHPHFLEGVECLSLDPSRVPRLEDVNDFLSPLSGFKSKAVSGYVPAYLFFDSLRRREFPTTITIRDGRQLDYLPEPDIFHDLAGHVPMHTDRTFSNVLVRFGEVARTAARQSASISDPQQRLRSIESVVKAMARFFWFTVEFGLMKSPNASSNDYDNPDNLCVIGSGLLSSQGEIEHSILSPDVQRYPLQLEWVVNQYFEIDHYQPLLFVAESFDHLYDEVDRLERWVLEGRLNNVSPGEPLVNEQDLQSFLEAETA